MKTSSYFKGKVKENFEKIFDKSVINRLSKSRNSVSSKKFKIAPFAIVKGLIGSCFTRFDICASAAAAIGAIIGKGAPKMRWTICIPFNVIVGTLVIGLPTNHFSSSSYFVSHSDSPSRY
jgi:hypothetical protein